MFERIWLVFEGEGGSGEVENEGERSRRRRRLFIKDPARLNSFVLET